MDGTFGHPNYYLFDVGRRWMGWCLWNYDSFHCSTITRLVINISTNTSIYNVFFLGYTGKLSAVYRKATALKTDERVRLMDEILSGIQVIKMYAWEKPFAKLIRFARKAEVKIITKSSYVRGLYMAFNLFTTRLAMFATLLTIALLDQQITAAKVKTMYFFSSGLK